MSPSPPVITVVGSINMDLVVRCASLPQRGETVLATSSAEVCGGKGANQAVAAARAGGQVSMVGRVGDDSFAGRLVTNLHDERIGCDLIEATSGCSSGVAIVAVEQSGQNSIMVVPGANGRVTADDVRAARQTIESSSILLVQLEIPLDAVKAAVEIAQQAGVRVVLDPAPVPSVLPPELFRVDVLCPNETEASVLAGMPVNSTDSAEAAARRLHELGARQVAITLGEQGTMVFDGTAATLVAPFAITAVDTTAAGDAFAGAFAVRWAAGASLLEAVSFANAAGALAASREGAQPGMATREEIERLQKG